MFLRASTPVLLGSHQGQEYLREVCIDDVDRVSLQLPAEYILLHVHHVHLKHDGIIGSTSQWTITNTKWFDYKTNIEVRSLTKRQPIQRYIAQSHLSCFGYLLRSPHNHPAHAIYTFNSRAEGWSRPRGAIAAWSPPPLWGDILNKDLKQLGTIINIAGGF